MKHHTIPRIVTKLIIPLILLFGLYIQFHGDYSAGGGFQAGVIFSSAFILYGLVFGLENACKVVSQPLVNRLAAAGVLIFAGTGYASLFYGGNYLDYDVLASNPLVGQHVGILIIEFGVGVTVAASMITIFSLFAGRKS